MLMQLTSHGCSFKSLAGAERQAELPRGALYEDSARDSQRGAGLRGDGRKDNETAEGEEPRCLREADASAELAGGGTEDAAPKTGVKWPEALDFEGEGGLSGRGCNGATTAANRFAGKQELREDAAELRLPTGLILAGEFGQVREGMVERGIELPELGK